MKNYYLNKKNNQFNPNKNNYNAKIRFAQKKNI